MFHYPGIEEEAATPDKAGTGGFSDPTAGTAASEHNGQELSQITQERNKLRETLQKVEQDKANIKKRLEQLQLQVSFQSALKSIHYMQIPDALRPPRSSCLNNVALRDGVGANNLTVKRPGSHDGD